ncbi:N-acetyl-gamma-glutamyl-phosphate reductase [Rubrobacter aplysinae]|uniref:N-acetyl-gamma-glutamyl-phosphate reductase n=1 Tax=Rubrobacter aplysinae TaxID=909625 RepID=UPI000AB52C07|nr:N-acetyl-gamma-glutamyl-phosphate reductase [Rubrobacter aplysinae]
MGLKVGIYGGSGYGGIELIRLLSVHPEVGSLEVASRGNAGQKISGVFPQLSAEGEFVAPEEVEAAGLDVAFVAYSHGESAETVARLLDAGAGLVVDLSADFRLPGALYAEWYGEHPEPGLIQEAHYGLPELFGTPENTRLIANPGCYPTAATLALAPVVKRLDGRVRSVTVNALSGVSGAGARPSGKTHYVSANENVSAYGFPRHRHAPEIQNVLDRVGETPDVTFVPHLVPVSRGILETITVEPEDPLDLPTAEEALGWYADDYSGWSFVEAREEYPQIAHVTGTNRVRLSAAVDETAGKLILFSAIDNLLKGASGAAVQNMNLALGHPEELGLEHLK